MKKKAEERASEQQHQWDIEARDEQRAYDRGALKRLVADADEAGFNPLSVLRNGGTSYQNSGAPLLSRRAVGGSPAGDALISAGQSFIENFDPYADQKREQEYRLIESQIASLNAGTLSRVSAGRRSYAQGDVERRPSGKAAALGKPSKWAPGDVTVTNPWQSADVNPNVADADAFEQRYGDAEIISTIYGGSIAAADVYQNAKNFAWDYLSRNVKVAPLSKKQKKRVEESWLPSWVPRVELRLPSGGGW